MRLLKSIFDLSMSKTTILSKTHKNTKFKNHWLDDKRKDNPDADEDEDMSS